MLFFTGSSHNSWTILKAQEEATRKSHGVAMDSLHQIRLLADKMRKALLAGSLREFGCLLDEAWNAKRKVSEKISDSRIDHLYATACDNGAIGGKSRAPVAVDSCCCTAKRIANSRFATL